MNTKSTWTHFWDMSSGGSRKEKFKHCFIEAPEEEAKIIFYNRFGHNPERVSCTCCGEDYAISQEDDLLALTAYQRGCRSAYFKDGVELSESESTWDIRKNDSSITWSYIEEAETTKYSKTYIALEDYMKSDDTCFIFANEIKDEERIGDVPEQGYIWR